MEEDKIMCPICKEPQMNERRCDHKGCDKIFIECLECEYLPDKSDGSVFTQAGWCDEWSMCVYKDNVLCKEHMIGKFYMGEDGYKVCKWCMINAQGKINNSFCNYRCVENTEDVEFCIQNNGFN